jgi:hypothetical protein
MNNIKLWAGVLFSLTFTCWSIGQSPFYSEDFSDGMLPAGWETTDASGNPTAEHILWEACTDPFACPPFTDLYFPGSFDGSPFASPTASNGYLFVKSNQGGLSLAPAVSRLTTQAFDCSDKDQVVLQFHSHIGTLFSAPYESAVVRVSTNNVTWTTFPVYPTLNIFDFKDLFTPKTVPVTVDISSVAANESTVYIRWQWTHKSDWTWSIDDMKLFDSYPPHEKAIWGHLPGQGDFDGGLNGWEVNNILPPDKGWKWTPNGYIGNAFSANDGFYIGSPSALNGAAVMNADFYTTNNQSPPPSAPNYLSELISPGIDLSGVEGSLSLRFHQIVRIFYGNLLPGYPGVTLLYYSTDDGQTWSTPIDVNPTLKINGCWLPEQKVIRLPDELAGEEQVKIKFVFAGPLYAWAIDDVVIYEREQNNLETKYDFAAFAPNALTPRELVDSLRFLVDVENVGQDTQTNVNAFISIRKKSNQELVFLDSIPIGTLAPGELADSLLFDRSFLPEASVNQYLAAYFTSANEEDEYAANDTVKWEFEVTDFVLSKELGPSNAFTPAGGETNYTYGNCFYIPPGANVKACKAEFSIGNAFSLVGKNVFVELYQWTEGFLDDEFTIEDGEYQLLSSRPYEIQGVEALKEPIVFDLQPDGSGIPLDADAYYFLVLKYEGETPFFIGVDDCQDYLASFFLYRTFTDQPQFFTVLNVGNTSSFDLIGLGNSGFDRIPVVRLHICNPTNTNALPVLPLQIQIAPNPVAEVLNVQLEATTFLESVEVAIINSLGQVMKKQRLDPFSGKVSTQFPVSDLPDGQYWLYCRNASGQRLEAFILKN